MENGTALFFLWISCFVSLIPAEDVRIVEKPKPKTQSSIIYQPVNHTDTPYFPKYELLDGNPGNRASKSYETQPLKFYPFFYSSVLNVQFHVYARDTVEQFINNQINYLTSSCQLKTLKLEQPEFSSILNGEFLLISNDTVSLIKNDSCSDTANSSQYSADSFDGKKEEKPPIQNKSEAIDSNVNIIERLLSISENHIFSCGILLGLSSLSWTDINVDALAFETVLSPTLRLFRGFGIRGEFSVVYGKTKKIDILFEKDIKEGDEIVGIKRVVPDCYQYRQMKLHMEFVASMAQDRIDFLYLYFGGGTAYIRDALKGREYGIDGKEFGYYSHRSTNVNCYKTLSFSGGLGLSYSPIALEIRSSVIVNPYTHNETYIRDSSKLIYSLGLVAGIYLAR